MFIYEIQIFATFLHNCWFLFSLKVPCIHINSFHKKWSPHTKLCSYHDIMLHAIRSTNILPYNDTQLYVNLFHVTYFILVKLKKKLIGSWRSTFISWIVVKYSVKEKLLFYCVASQYHRHCNRKYHWASYNEKQVPLWRVLIENQCNKQYIYSYISDINNTYLVTKQRCHHDNSPTHYLYLWIIALFAHFVIYFLYSEHKS